MNMSLTRSFLDAFRNHPAGVAILTAAGDAGPVALTVSSLISVSADPPMVGFSLSNTSRTAAQILAAQTFLIHLPRYTDMDLAVLCSTPDRDRFADTLDWDWLPTGEPRYRQIPYWFRAKVTETMPLAAATVISAELLSFNDSEDQSFEGDALVYHNKFWRRLKKSTPT